MRRELRIPPAPTGTHTTFATLALLAGCTLLGVMGCSPQSRPETRDDASYSGARAVASGTAPTCSPPTRIGTTPSGLDEASGLVASREHPGVFWTHEDSGRPAVIIAIDSAGRRLGRVRVTGARNQDWEDIALGPCPTGECLYLADTGDNRLRREEVVVYRIPEPAPGDTVSATAERFPLRFPGGPRDVEALYILPDGALYLVSKGRRHPIELFRYGPPLREGETAVVHEIQRLSEGDGGVPLPFQVTGASATPDGRWVALRTYSTVQLYRPDETGYLTPALPPQGLDLQALAEPQGEGVSLRGDGTLFLISEAGPLGVPGTVGRLHCQLPAGIDGAPSMR